MSSIVFHEDDHEMHEKVVLDCFSKLWHHSVDFMFIMAVEPNGEFSLYENNPASKRIMGLNENTAIHRFNIRETWSDEVVEGLYETYRKAIAHGSPVSYEQYASLNGSSIFVDTLFVPIFDEIGNPRFVCGVSRDISKIKEAEKIAVEANVRLKEYTEALEGINSDLDEKVKKRTCELEKATQEIESVYRAKSAFLSRMSHEIRTPVNAIVGLASMMGKTKLTSAQQIYLEKISQASQFLAEVVNDTLDLSKLEAGKLEIEQVEFSPEKIMQEAVNIMALKAYDKNLDLAVNISINLPEILIGDPLRIKQITINLLSNAIKFTEKGYINLVVEYDHDNSILKWSVIDTGKGISDINKASLFKLFNQLEKSTSREYGGTALGLAMSQQLSYLMGGEVFVESVLGQGSCFSVKVPLSQSVRNKSNLYDGINNNTGNILLVDNSPASSLAIRDMLSEIGFDVDLCDDVTCALSKIQQSCIRKEPYNKIMIDMQMFSQKELYLLFDAFNGCYQGDELIKIDRLGRTLKNENRDSIDWILEKPLFLSSLISVCNNSVYNKSNTTISSSTNGLKRQFDWGGYSILVVDDNEINQQVIRGYLSDTGINIVSVMNGKDAIEYLNEREFDIVLMDINMPNMDGFETTSIIRRYFNDTELPIVAVTAYSSEDVLEKVVSVGMSAHLSKPICGKKLYETLSSFLTSYDIKQDDKIDLQEGLDYFSYHNVLNIPLALQRLQGRRSLLLEVLDGFYHRYFNSDLVLKPFDISDKHLFDECHSLKSSSSYIGAETLLSLCQNVKPSENPLSIRREINIELGHVLRSICEIGKSNFTVKMESSNEFLDYINLLMEQLSQSNFSAKQTVEILLQCHFCSDDMKSILNDIYILIENVEFEDAHDIAQILTIRKDS
ncbi:TPA: response regulator [Vibrio vulnificus]|nr:response regulator [Vibrio vulnificus]